MTDLQIKTIEALRYGRKQLAIQHDKEDKAFADKITELTSQCDHRLPDGSSAMVGTMFYISCSICHESDL